ncbi:ABC transporter permease [Bacteroidia bacterium]|nr:ABC transporter permease [Bacteroidia bacterium]GHT49098.1 ABC transporter permease [Bacteroidia bacterium]
MIKHYLTVAFRNLRKYKVQNLIGILGLSTGFVVFAICCYLVQYRLTRDSSYPDHQRMYRIETRRITSINGNMKNTLGEFTDIEKVTSKNWPISYYGNMTIDGKETMVNLTLQEVDTIFLDFFSLQILSGSKQNILQTPNSIALYESSAKKYGDPATLPGTTITFDAVSYTITGILKNLPSNNNISHGNGLVFNKSDGYYGKEHDSWNPMREVRVYVLLKKGISQAEFQQKLDAYPFAFEQPNPDYKEYLFISSINKIDESEFVVLAGIFIVGLLVLFIALFNYISFQTAQFYNRLKECAIRTVNGSGNRQQLFLFYSEIVIVFILSYFGGLLLLEIVIPILENSQFSRMINPYVITGFRIQLLQSVITGLVIAFLLCIAPVTIIGRSSVRVVLLGISERGSKERGRKILLFIQMIILLFFMSATLIIKFQTNKVKENVFHTLLPQEQKNILTFAYDEMKLPDNLPIIMQKLKTSNAIEDISFANFPIYSYGSLFQANTGIEGHEKEDVRNYMVDDNFLDFFKLKLLSGSFLDENSSPGAVVVDETFAALFPDHNPVGMSFENNTIIGVVENIQVVKENKEFTHIKRPVYYSRADKHKGEIYIKAFPGKAEEARQDLIQTVREFLPEPIDLRISDLHENLNEDLFDIENVLSLFSTLFFIISLILSLLSIYSAIAMNTEKRRKEVAIRKINGAEIKDIILLFSKTYLWLWSAACIVLFPVVYYFGNVWISGFSQRMSLNVFFFLGIYFSVLVLIFLTLIFHIMRVARCNPAEVVKMS